MIRPEPDSFADLMAELLVERFGPTGRAERLIDSPAVIARRQQVLELLTPDEDEGALVLPFGRRRAERAA